MHLFKMNPGQMWKALTLITLVQYISKVKCKNPNVKKDYALGENDGFLKIGKVGYLPWHFVKNGITKGSDMKLIEIISAKLNFSYNVVIVNNFDEVVQMVILME